MRKNLGIAIIGYYHIILSILLLFGIIHNFREGGLSSINGIQIIFVLIYFFCGFYLLKLNNLARLVILGYSALIFSIILSINLIRIFIDHESPPNMWMLGLLLLPSLLIIYYLTRPGIKSQFK